MRIASFSRGSDDAHLLIGKARGQLWKRENVTEPYVTIPPAMIITDSDGAVWSLGFEFNVYGELNVLRNDIDTGEFAQWVEYRRGTVRLFGRAGRRVFSRSRRHFI